MNNVKKLHYFFYTKWENAFIVIDGLFCGNCNICLLFWQYFFSCLFFWRINSIPFGAKYRIPNLQNLVLRSLSWHPMASSLLTPAMLVVVLCLAMSMGDIGFRPVDAARAFFVFGDSLVDNGNNNYLATTARADMPPYGIDYPTHRPTGRFSNGFNIPDFISWGPFDAHYFPYEICVVMDNAQFLSWFLTWVTWVQVGVWARSQRCHIWAQSLEGKGCLWVPTSHPPALAFSTTLEFSL